MTRDRMRAHLPALVTITAAAMLDAIGGVAFAAAEHLPVQVGLYWAVSTATTVGYGDVTPHTTAGYYIAVAVMLTVVPLWVATFSLFTAALTAGHVHAAKNELKNHITEQAGGCGG